MEARKAELLGRDLLRALGRLSHGRPEWLPAILHAARRATGAAVVYLVEAGENGWSRTAAVGDRIEQSSEERLGGLSRRMASDRAAILEPRLGRGTRFRSRCDGWGPLKATGFAAVPVPHAARPAWLAALSGSGDPALDTSTLNLLETSAEAVSAALLGEARWAELEDLAMTDGLTHIPNYRYLRLAVEQEILRAERLGEYFSVVMVDVDNLKAYNGAHGHLAGSEVLRTLAGLLRENTRKTDLAAKYGGDEFVLVLPRTRPAGGKVLSERIRLTIEGSLRGIGGERISCSFGVAGYPDDGRDFEGLVQAADRALFRAKSEGRNAVVCLAAGDLEGGAPPDAEREAA